MCAWLMAEIDLKLQQSAVALTGSPSPLLFRAFLIYCVYFKIKNGHLFVQLLNQIKF